MVLSDTKIVACVKWDTFVWSCVPSRSPCRSSIGPASSCVILDFSSRQCRWTFQWVVCSCLEALTSAHRLEKGWSQIILSPWALLHLGMENKIAWQQEENIFMYPVWALLQLLGWRGDPQGWVKPEADQDEFLAPLPTEPVWVSWTSGGTEVAAECLFL